MLKTRISKLDPEPKDKISLKKALRAQWKKDEKSGNHFNLINSFQKKIKKVKRKKLTINKNFFFLIICIDFI